MSIEWTPDLAAGFELVDRQNQELLRRLDSLVTAIKAGQSRESIDATLAFLERYVVEHFGTEQLLMQTHRYPHQTAHQAQHESFLYTFNGVKKAYQEQGPTDAIAIQLQKVLCSWLRKHIGRTDKALGWFLAAQRGPAKPDPAHGSSSSPVCQ